MEEKVQTPTTNPIKPVVPKPNFFIPVLSIVIFLLLVSTGFLGYQNYLLQQKINKMVQPTPTATADPTADWKTYTTVDKSVSFKYPSTLFTISKDPHFIKFFLSENEAKDDENCIQNHLGTTQKPCGQFMVLNIGISKYPTDYQFSLKNSLNITDPGLIKPISYMDAQNRTWLVEGPIEIPGAFNIKAETEQSSSLYQVSISIGSEGFQRYLNTKLTNNQAAKFSNQILSTFKFTETNTSKVSECLEKTSCKGATPCMANPASVFCTCMGGESQIKETDKGQAGICKIDGNEYDEWEYFRKYSSS